MQKVREIVNEVQILVNPKYQEDPLLKNYATLDLNRQNIASSKTIAIIGDQEDVEHFHLACRLNKNIQFIFIGNSNNFLLREVRNPSFIFSKWDSEGIQEVIDKALETYIQSAQRKALLSATHQELKKRKSLLEKRSLMFDVSKEEIEEIKKQTHIYRKAESGSLKFTNQVVYSKNLESFFKAFIREVKKVLDFYQVFLIEKIGDTDYDFYHLSNQHLNTYNFSIKEEAFEEKIRPYLANVLQRPILHLDFLNLNESIFLAIEREKDKRYGERFTDWWAQNHAAFSLVCQYLIQQERIYQHTMIWQKTFYAYKSPLALFDLNGDLLEANHSYQELIANEASLRTDMLLEYKEPLQIKGETYQIKSYQISLFAKNDSQLVQLINLNEREKLHTGWMQSEKMASMGNLAGNLSHELSNPLTGIKLAVEELMQEEEDLKDDLLEIKGGVERSFAIINNFKNFSNPNVQRTEKINILNLVNQTLSLVKTELRNHKVRVSGSEELSFQGNFPLMQQALFNLLHNSVQAMDSKGGRIDIEWQEKPNEVIIKVSDNGPGIANKMIKKIFQPFYTTKPTGEGTGLGLSICQRIIEKHHGHIEIDKEPKKGVTFWITLPIK